MLRVQVASRFVDATQERAAEGMQLVDEPGHFSSLDCGARAHTPRTHRPATARERFGGRAPSGISRVPPAAVGPFSEWIVRAEAEAIQHDRLFKLRLAGDSKVIPHWEQENRGPMPRMNPRQHAAAYQFLVLRDGEKCGDCNKLPVAEVQHPDKEVRKLIIHHVDRNPSNNPVDGSNWLLLCQSCNVRRDPRGPQSYAKFTSHLRLKTYYLSEKDVEKHTPKPRYAEMAKSEEAHLLFRSFVAETVAKLVSVNKWTLLDAGAEEFHKRTGQSVSQQALAKVLDQLCNMINGDFQYCQEGEEGDWFVRRRNEKP
jgi:hypothetical protein